MICEADYVDGTLSRTIKFDHSRLSEDDTDTTLKKIEKVEEDLELHQFIKNHIVFNALLYGESYTYVIPYAKVFEDLYRYKSQKISKKGKYSSNSSNWEDMSNSSIMNGFGYGEHAVEVSLKDLTFVQESVLKYEPHLALFADNHGLAIYEKIFSQVDKVSKDKCLIALEISPDLVDRLTLLRDKYLPNYKFKFEKDMNNLIRFMFLYK
jgi:hypothetical protein